MIARHLSVLSHAQGVTWRHDRLAAAADDFLRPAKRLFSAGDMVLVAGGVPTLPVVERRAGGVKTRPLARAPAGGGSPYGGAPAQPG